MIHRCATGEHRGETIEEHMAAVVACAQILISARDVGWEKMVAVPVSARDVWPHLCFTLDSDWCIYDRAGGPDEPCQAWTLHVKEQDWERLSASYRGLMEHMRQTNPELCAQWQENYWRLTCVEPCE